MTQRNIETEITPEMIEAGAEALQERVGGVADACFDFSHLALLVYSAMIAARCTTGSQRTTIQRAKHRSGSERGRCSSRFRSKVGN